MTRELQFCRSFALVVAVATIIAGIAVLIGWGFGVSALRSVIPGADTMKPLTALTFVLAGLSLGLVCAAGGAPPSRTVALVRGAQFCSLLVLLSGLLTLVQYSTGVDFGTDELLFPRALAATGVPRPGSMAAAAALGFVLLGAALASTASGNSRLRRLHQPLALTLALLGALALEGYLFGADALYRVSAYSSMALHTAALFALLALGVPCTRPDAGMMAVLTSPSAGGLVARRLLPAVVLLPVAGGWFRWYGERAGWYGTAFGLSLFVTFVIVTFGTLVWTSARRLNLLDAERAAAERSEQGNQSRLSGIIGSAMDGIITVDDAQRITLFNAAAERMFAVRAEELIGQPLDRLIPDRFRPAHGDHIRAFGRTNVTRRTMGELGAIYGRRSDGEEFPIEASISQVEVAGQKLFTVILRDTAERDRQVERLRESEERFRQLAENIQEVFWMTDPGKRQMLYVSPAYERIWGRSGDTLYADPRNWLEAVHPEDRERVREAALSRQVAGTYDEEYRIVRPDGTLRWISDRAFPVRDADGKVHRVVGVAEDVTDRKRAEETRLALESQLLQSQKMDAVGQLAGGIAHDFNNMLNVILGNTELAFKKSAPSEAVQKRLREIEAAAKRSAELTRQLLAFSRRQVIAPRKLLLNEALRGMERLLRRVIGEDIDLVFVLPPDTWPVLMDPSQVDQVLANLAVNSRDGMPDGGKLTIEVRNVVIDHIYCLKHADATPGDYVMVAVSDTGCGMDARTRERAFEPFFTTKPEGQGTGLGLATVYGIVKQNNGSVDIYSEVGRGTTVKLCFPRHEGTENPVLVAPPPPRAVGQVTLLLVEDEHHLREIAKELLIELGYTVLDAPGPEEALELCRRHEGTVHLLLTDVVMPAMNGMELAARVQALKPEIRVLYMSGYPATAIAHRGVLDPGIPLLEKPFSLATLAAKVQEVLGA